MKAVPVTLGRKSPNPVHPVREWHPDALPFQSAFGHHVLIPDGSRIYDIDQALHREILSLSSEPISVLDERLQQVGLTSLDHIGSGAADTLVDVRYASLAVAQSCNLGCTYCYADGGDFGGTPSMMSTEVARATVDRLLGEATPGGRIGLAYIGGEPLLNRSLIHQTTAYAAKRAASADVEVTFSITSNGTLLQPEDIDLFDRYGFSVTISLDGVGEAHDAVRQTRSGGGTWQRILDRVEPMIARQGLMQVSARASITPENMAVRHTVRDLIDRGFHSVGIAPVLRSPNGSGELHPNQLDALLSELKGATQDFLAAVEQGRRYPFSNVTSALQMIHRGTHRPYACGAGGAYLGIGADGAASACHRFVGDEAGAMGDVFDGWNQSARQTWATERHVDQQEPCSSCWARYLCGGGCHHEVIGRGRTSCDFIRAWLEHCLSTYVELVSINPRYFE